MTRIGNKLRNWIEILRYTNVIFCFNQNVTKIELFASLKILQYFDISEGSKHLKTYGFLKNFTLSRSLYSLSVQFHSLARKKKRKKKL